MADDELAALSVAALRVEARAELRAAGIERVDGDVRILMAEALGRDGAWLHLNAQAPVEADAAARLRGWLVRRQAGEPVHRILGRRSFYDHDFELSPDTLEPRPDTETLVELAAEAIRHKLESRPSLIFADLGTGSGAIAVSLLALFATTRALAVDLSTGALATARRNAGAAGVGARFMPLAGDYLAACGARLDIVVSNPPYIRTDAMKTLAIDVRAYDPPLALDGGPDGLDAYRAIASQMPDCLAQGGDVIVEIGAGQMPDVVSLFESAGCGLIASRTDLGGHERALWFRHDSVVK